MSQASTRSPLADISVIELGGIGPTPSPSPAPGQDTRAILADLGHTSSDIERLLAEGVVRVTDTISQNGPK